MRQEELTFTDHLLSIRGALCGRICSHGRSDQFFIVAQWSLGSNPAPPLPENSAFNLPELSSPHAQHRVNCGSLQTLTEVAIPTVKETWVIAQQPLIRGFRGFDFGALPHFGGATALHRDILPFWSLLSTRDEHQSQIILMKFCAWRLTV